MAQGTVTALASGTAADGTLGPWTNLTNVFSDDGSYATREGTTKNIWYGNLLSFDLSGIPETATIGTVTMTAEWANNAADSAGPVLMLAAQTNGTLYDVGTTDTSGQTTPEVLSYTPSGLSAAQLRATGTAGFYGVLRYRRTDNIAHVGSVDYYQISVVYTTVDQWNVTPAEATQNQTSDIPTVASIYLLAPAEGTQSQVSDAAVVASIYPLAPAEGTQSQLSDPAVLSVAVSPDEATQSQLSDAAQVNAVYVLAPAEGSQAQTSDAASLGATISRKPDGGIQSQTSDPVVVTAQYVITVAEASQAQVMDIALVEFQGAGAVYNPQTGLLDDFNRADESPLDAQLWGGPFAPAQGAWKIVNQEATPVG